MVAVLLLLSIAFFCWHQQQQYILSEGASISFNGESGLHFLCYLLVAVACYCFTMDNWVSCLYYVFYAVCYQVAILDYQYQRISVIHCYLLLVCALLLAAFEISSLALFDAVISFSTAFVSGLLLYLLLYLSGKTNALGLGDVLLFPSLALLISVYFLPYLLLISSIIAILHYLLLSGGRGRYIPFAPSLVIAALSLFLLQESGKLSFLN
ncbi:peptidase [Gallibacterium genomosp. 1]|uniref:Peptidase n=2 Tax=Gallibacterium genomosp. 1 TaxID=155515 RepID=A0AB36DZA1_9PAST|nr:peptidase [Gallibacterium genomosp. 1]OBX03442.1 peptidase [Gallibacterium genomosp. 1]